MTWGKWGWIWRNRDPRYSFVWGWQRKLSSGFAGKEKWRLWRSLDDPRQVMLGLSWGEAWVMRVRGWELGCALKHGGAEGTRMIHQHRVAPSKLFTTHYKWKGQSVKESLNVVTCRISTQSQVSQTKQIKLQTNKQIKQQSNTNNQHPPPQTLFFVLFLFLFLFVCHHSKFRSMYLAI